MSQHDRTPQPKNPPRTEKKKQRMEADRGVWLADCKERLVQMEANDLAGMFGLMGNMIVDRIHDTVFSKWLKTFQGEESLQKTIWERADNLSV